MLSDTATLFLLIGLVFAAVVTIHWAWVTRDQDGPYVSDFVRPERERKMMRME